MKTNYLLLSIAFIFSVVTSFSPSTNFIIKDNKKGFVVGKDTFNVMASHGIYLRNSANLTSKKLAKLPYATKLISLNQDTISKELTIQETKYFEIKGRMQKVKVVSQIDSLNDLEGYVFDGYLTKFPVPKLYFNSNNEEEYVFADLYYLKSNFQEHEKYEVKRIDYYDCERDCICSFKQKFGNQQEIEYETYSCKEAGGTSWKIAIPNLSIKEAYFFAVVLYYNDYNKEANNFPHSLNFDKDKNSLHIYPSDSGAGCYIDISKNDNNTLTISGYCGC